MTAAPALDRAQLEGFVVALTSDRRSEELGAAFARRGARVVHAATLRIRPLEEDAEVLEATRAVVADPPDDVVVTTAIGFRAWMEAADAAGLAPSLLTTLDGARLLARGPKVRGAIQAAGLVEAWAAESETTQEVVQRLLDEGVEGRRVVVQQHGWRDVAAVRALEEAGASVREVHVYRWGPSPDPAAVARLVESCVARTVDAVAFTSAPGAVAFLDAAEAVGRREAVLEALDRDVLAGAVGEVTAAPLRAAGLAPLVPDRARLGALVRAMADALAAGCLELPTQGGYLQLRGQAAALDARFVPLSPVPLTVLRMLARAGGGVVGRPELLAALPGAEDAHAVEVAVARLRAALGPGVVQTVVKRGYRLQVEQVSRPTVTASRSRPSSSVPVLVACAHGTRSTAGRRAAWALRHAVEARRPGLDVRPAFVDVQSPQLDAVVTAAAGEGRPVVVVPLLLSGGYHVHVDVARAVARAGAAAVAAEALGPDDALVDVLRTRMTQARVGPGDGVVLAAAGSSDARAVEAVEEVARRLSRSLSVPVLIGYLSAARPRLADVVAAARAQGARRVAVATYLLAPGMFAEWVAGAGADVVTDPLLRGDGTADPALADLVLRRYDTAAAQLQPDATR